jgi:SWI/SNF-related matrix-associated actin-dependent regulator of chromatin subfamily A3
MERLSKTSSIKEAIDVLEYYNKSVNTQEECPICLDKQANVILKPCGHQFCNNCVDKMIDLNIKKCAMCRSCVSEYEEKNVDNKNVISCDELKISQKIKYLINLINEKIEKDEKIVIVSQWVTMLDMVRDLVSKNIRETNVKSISLQGNISLKQRAENINKFQNDKDYKICYLSLMSSAEGINLTSCNNMVLLDSWWNESKMSQVIDRLHRIGQTKSINIYKLLIQNSIEEKIKEVVTHKSKIVELVINKWMITDLKKYNDDWMKKIIKLIERIN